MNIRWLWFDYVPNDITLTKTQRRLVNKRAYEEMHSGRTLVSVLIVIGVGSTIAGLMLHYILPTSFYWPNKWTGILLLVLNYHLSFWIFARPHVFRIIRDLGVNVCPDCGYDLIEREQIVQAVRGWKPDITRSTKGTVLGVQDPESLHSYQPDLILRALVKIGLNLLAYVLSPTDVNSTTFPTAIKYARWGTGGTPNPQKNGFVTGDTLSEYDCPIDAHKFELVYLNRRWRLVAVFFGGRIGTCVHFPGRQVTDYIRYEIVAPVKSREWTVTKSKVHLPIRAIRTVWADLSAMVPSMPIRHRGSRTRVEQRWRK